MRTSAVRVRALLAASMICGALVAQNQWIVDDGGGPGVNFTSLPAAER